MVAAKPGGSEAQLVHRAVGKGRTHLCAADDLRPHQKLLEGAVSATNQCANWNRLSSCRRPDARLTQFCVGATPATR